MTITAQLPAPTQTVAPLPRTCRACGSEDLLYVVAVLDVTACACRMHLGAVCATLAHARLRTLLTIAAAALEVSVSVHPNHWTRTAL